MRVSDKQVYNQLTYNLRKNTERMLDIQNSLSSGKKIEAPSDDPIGNSRSLNYTSLLSKLEQYGKNIDRGMGTLGLNDSSLSGVTGVLIRLKELAVQMSSDTNTPEDRAIAAKEVRQLLLEIVDLANARDGEEYIYAGFDVKNKPFTPATVTAAGARNTGAATVSSGLVTDENRATLDDYVIKFTAADRYDIYRVPDTVTASDSGPVSSQAVVGGASVIDTGAMTLDRYEVRFSDPGGGAPMGYDIVDTTRNVTLSSGNVYTSGSAIEFDGLHIEISDGAAGGPANGDIFSVSAVGASVSSGNAYTSGAAINFEGLQVVVTDGASGPAANDAFTVRTKHAFNGDLNDRRIAVGENTTTPVGMSGGDLFSGLGGGTDLLGVVKNFYNNLMGNSAAGLDTAISQVDLAMGQVSSFQAEVGARVNHLDSTLQNIEAFKFNITSLKSEIEDIDLSKVASDLAFQEAALQAARETVARMIQPSLLDFLK